MCLRDYAGVFAEFSIEERVSAEQAIRDARAKAQTCVCPLSTLGGNVPPRALGSAGLN